jgi:signal transduction histidine kinase
LLAAPALEDDPRVSQDFDPGPRIDADHLPHIFTAYWQADASRGGAGIGLSICKAIVEAHGGTIRVESVKGRGTRFLFGIPMSGAGRDG